MKSAMASSLSRLFTLNDTPNDIEPVTPAAWLQVGAVFVMTILAMGSVQFSKYQMVGTDSFYHTSAAELIREEGLVKSLPWVSASVYRDRYADTEVLFHAMLIPFVGKEKRIGPKIFTVLLSSLILSLLAWVMVRHGMPYSWLWITLILSAGVALTFRLNLTRPHLLSLMLSILFAHFMLSRNTLGLLIVSLIFPMVYVAAHLLLVLLVIYFAACFLTGRRLPWTYLLISITGIGTAIAINPYRANWPYIWWILNVGDLSDVVLKAAMPVREFIPPSASDVMNTGLILPTVLAMITFVLVTRTKLGLRSVFLSLVATAFFVLYLLYQRFVIYFIPFTALAMASISADTKLHLAIKNQAGRHRHWSAVLMSLGLLLLCGQLLRSVVMSQKSIGQENTPRYTNAARWMNKHVPPGTNIFTCQWDSTPFLIYYAPALRYINVLSPNFMIAYDLELYKSWISIRDGRAPDAMQLIPSKFHSNWLFIEKDKTPAKLLEQALSSPGAKLMYDDYQSAIFRLAP